jgi:hypothetical protein
MAANIIAFLFVFFITVSSQTTNTQQTSATVTHSSTVAPSSHTSQQTTQQTTTVATSYSTTGGSGQVCNVVVIPEVVMTRTDGNYSIYDIDTRIYNLQTVALLNVVISLGYTELIDSWNFNVTVDGTLTLPSWLTATGGIHAGKVFHAGVTVESLTVYGPPTFSLDSYTN